MNEELAKQIAEEIINQSPTYNYLPYILIALITLTTSTIGHFLSSYFKARGQNLATRTDFEAISSQIRETTLITENIKTQISSDYLEKANHRSTIRQKLEETIDETFKLELWLEQTRGSALKGILPDTNSSPLAKIEMYQTIYFRSIKAERMNLQQHTYPLIRYSLEIATHAKSAPDKIPSADKFEKLQSEFLEKLDAFRDTLIKEYSEAAGL